MDKHHTEQASEYAGLTIDIQQANSSPSGQNIQQNDSIGMSSTAIDSGESANETNAINLDSLQSAGFLFPPPYTAQDGLAQTVQGEYHREQTEPRGFVQGGTNMCYRNAAIVALLNSQRFMSYVSNWHMQHENLTSVEPKSTSMEPESTSEGSKSTSKRPKSTSKRPKSTSKGPKPTSPPSLILHELHDLGKLYWAEPVGKTHTGAKFYDGCMREFFRKCNSSTDRLPDHEREFGSWMAWASRIFSEVDKIPKGQQDVSDFTFWLLEAVERQLSRDPRFTNESVIPVDAYRQTQPQENFNALFRLRLTERSACLSCQQPVWNRRENVRTELTLQLPIPSTSGAERAGTLLDSVREYMNSIQESRCPRCHSEENVKMPTQVKLQSLPEVLFVDLNRLGSMVVKEKGLKVFKAFKRYERVSIPEELDLSEWLEHHEYGPGSQAKYRLSSIVSHLGDQGFGHYINIVRGTDDSQWYSIDNKHVTPVKLSDYDDTGPIGDFEAEADRWTPRMMVYEKIVELRRPGQDPRGLLFLIDRPPDADPPAKAIDPSPFLPESSALSQPLPDVDSGTEAIDPSLSLPDPSALGQQEPEGSPRAQPIEPSRVSPEPPALNPDEPGKPAGATTNPEDDLFGSTPEPWQPATPVHQSYLTPSSAQPQPDNKVENAQLFVHISVGNIELELPPQLLEQYDPLADRELKVQAVVQAKDSDTKEDLYLELLNARVTSSSRWRRGSPSTKVGVGGTSPKPANLGPRGS